MTTCNLGGNSARRLPFADDVSPFPHQSDNHLRGDTALGGQVVLQCRVNLTCYGRNIRLLRWIKSLGY